MTGCKRQKPNAFKFTWIISGYLFSPRENIQSPLFSSALLEGTAWCIGVHLSTPGNVNSIEGYLQRTGGRREPEEICFNLQFKVCVRNCLIIDKVSPKKVILKRNERMQLFTFQVHNLQLGDYESYNSELRIECTFALSMSQEKHLLFYNSMDLEILSKDIEKLRKDELFYDTIIVAENKEFKVHRAILEARIPKAARQLPVDFTSSLLSTTKMPDISSSSMQSVFHYVYSGVLRIPSASELNELTLASEKFSLTNLRQQIFTGRGHCVTSTKLKIQTQSFFWTINRVIPHISDQNSLFLDVPFEHIRPKVMRIYFGMYLSEKNEEFLTISFKFPTLDVSSPILMVCKFALMNGTHRLYAFDDIHHVFDSDKTMAFRPLVAKSALPTIAETSRYDKLVTPTSPFLKFSFNIELCDGEQSSGFELTKGDISRNSIHSKDYERLSTDMAKLYDDLTFSDMNLLTESGHTFPSHRCVLGARSQVMKEIILKEGKNRCITLPGITASALSAFLDYIYTGKFKQLTHETVVELQKVANDYKMPMLKSRALLQLRIQSVKK